MCQLDRGLENAGHWRRCVIVTWLPSKTQASVARREGLGTFRGLVNGIIFTIGLWLAITGLVLLIRH